MNDKEWWTRMSEARELQEGGIAPVTTAERGRVICEDALKTINSGRLDQYGAPENSFAKIAALWSSYLGREIEGSDVANMMILLKVAREKDGKGKKDNYVDLIGYAAIAARMRGYDE